MTNAVFAGNLALHRRGFRIQRVHAACDLPLPFFRQRVFSAHRYAGCRHRHDRSCGCGCLPELRDRGQTDRSRRPCRYPRQHASSICVVEFLNCFQKRRGSQMLLWRSSVSEIKTSSAPFLQGQFGAVVDHRLHFFRRVGAVGNDQISIEFLVREILAEVILSILNDFLSMNSIVVATAGSRMIFRHQRQRVLQRRKRNQQGGHRPRLRQQLHRDLRDDGQRAFGTDVRSL